MPTLPITGSIVHISEISQGTQFAVSSSRQDNGIGVVLPIGKSADGMFFKQSYTTIDAAKSNIKNLILTMRGERIMHPTLGSGLWSLIFEPMQGEGAEDAVKQTIIENVRVWLPYISIDKLEVVFKEDNNAVEILMELSLKNDPQTKDTLYLNISKGDL
jgi:phage baseplate assembly protein W